MENDKSPQTSISKYFESIYYPPQRVETSEDAKKLKEARQYLKKFFITLKDATTKNSFEFNKIYVLINSTLLELEKEEILFLKLDKKGARRLYKTYRCRHELEDWQRCHQYPCPESSIDCRDCECPFEEVQEFNGGGIESEEAH